MDFDSNQVLNNFGLALIVLFLLYPLIFQIVKAVSLWKIFEKSNQPGWPALIPVVRMFFLMKIIGKPKIWAILIPLADIFFYASIATPFEKRSLVVIFLGCLSFSFQHNLYNSISEYFNKPKSLLNLFFPILFYPKLAFGDSSHKKDTLK